jgi:DNA invertase Pin-like site-specific DNA recombinase
MFQIIGAMAEFERALIQERARNSLKSAGRLRVTAPKVLPRMEHLGFASAEQNRKKHS